MFLLETLDGCPRRTETTPLVADSLYSQILAEKQSDRSPEFG